MAQTRLVTGRFKRPGLPKPWSGTRSCRAFGPQSPYPPRSIWDNDEEGFLFQWDFGRNSEDCLRLNIWTPALDGKEAPGHVLDPRRGLRGWIRKRTAYVRWREYGYAR